MSAVVQAAPSAIPRFPASGTDAAGGPRPVRRVVAPHRLLALDACRGVAVLGMLLANLVNVFLTEVPDLLSHNRGDELRLFDLPAPMFQFLVGVSLSLFLRARTAKLEALRRFVLLILLGMVLDGIAALSPVPRWGVLQTLGLGGIAATLLHDLPDEVSVVVALVLLGIFSGRENGVVHGNPIAALAFVPLTLAGSLLGKRLRDGTGPAVALALVGLALAVVLFAAGVPFDKVRGTSSFVTLTAGISAGVLAVAVWMEYAGKRFPWWLLAVGRNALTTWVTLYLLVYYPAWIVFPSWQRLPVLPGAAAALAVTAALCAGTIALWRRGIRVPL
jgi:predicted acyltransferase